jgi:hypothetical protein
MRRPAPMLSTCALRARVLPELARIHEEPSAVIGCGYRATAGGWSAELTSYSRLLNRHCYQQSGTKAAGTGPSRIMMRRAVRCPY